HRLLVGVDLSYRHQKPAVRGERGQRGLHLAGGGLTHADQGHGEMAAQSGHGRVGEIQAERGEDLRGLRDDAGPVAPEHGDGEFMHDGTMPHRTRPAPARPARYAEVAIEWYAEHARDLPWRHAGTTPWGVLVSEVMLQQTPVV